MDELMEQQRTAPAPSGNNQMMINRQAQEVQAAMVIAKNFRVMNLRRPSVSKGRVREEALQDRLYTLIPVGGSGFPAHLLDLLKHLLRHGGI